MAQKRSLSNLDPVRKSDLSELMRTAPPEQTLFGDFRRTRHFTERLQQEETILRWFRILTDAETTAAAAAGKIWETGVPDNDLRKRSIVPCPNSEDPPSAPTEEPEPSMWGIEITRDNCQQLYRDRPNKYELIHFPAIKSDADLAAIGTDLKDERVLCWWNSNSGHWEAITGEGGTTEAPPAAISCCMEFVQVCDDTPNNCCLMDGIRIHLDATATETFCAPNICFIPVWIWVWQGGLEPGVSFGLAQDYCDFGQLVKSAHTCEGEETPTRDVFAISVGQCKKFCPGEEVEVTIQTPVECITGEHKFTAKCVMEDPIRLNGERGWWGEFELSGSYPQIGIPIDVEPFLVGGDAIDVVYVVVGCQATNLCETDKYYIDRGAGYEPYAGTFETTTNPATVISNPVPITDSEGCVLQCSRTFRYGVYFRCDPLSGGLLDGKIYRLHHGSMASAGTTDNCLTPPTTVPLPTDSINGTGDDIAFAPRGCVPFQDGDIDWNVSTTGESCDIDLLNAVPPAVFAGGAPFLYETFGGCLSWQRLIEININEPIPACEDFPVTEIITMRFDWTGTDQCKEQ